MIGEAVKQLPSAIKQAHPEVEWRKVAGLRDVVIHAYFGVDLDIVWDLATNRIPDLKFKIEAIRGLP